MSESKSAEPYPPVVGPWIVSIVGSDMHAKPIIIGYYSGLIEHIALHLTRGFPGEIIYFSPLKIQDGNKLEPLETTVTVRVTSNPGWQLWPGVESGIGLPPITYKLCKTGVYALKAHGKLAEQVKLAQFRDLRSRLTPEEYKLLKEGILDNIENAV